MGNTGWIMLLRQHRKKTEAFDIDMGYIKDKVGIIRDTIAYYDEKERTNGKAKNIHR